MPCLSVLINNLSNLFHLVKKCGNVLFDIFNFEFNLLSFLVKVKSLCLYLILFIFDSSQIFLKLFKISIFAVWLLSFWRRPFGFKFSSCYFSQKIIELRFFFFRENFSGHDLLDPSPLFIKLPVGHLLIIFIWPLGGLIPIFNLSYLSNQIIDFRLQSIDLSCLAVNLIIDDLNIVLKNKNTPLTEFNLFLVFINLMVVFLVQLLDSFLFFLSGLFDLLDFFLNVIELFLFGLLIRFVLWLFWERRDFCAVVDGILVVLEAKAHGELIFSSVGRSFV